MKVLLAAMMMVMCDVDGGGSGVELVIKGYEYILISG